MKISKILLKETNKTLFFEKFKKKMTADLTYTYTRLAVASKQALIEIFI